MSVIELPRLVGTRQAASLLLSPHAPAFLDQEVVVDCSQLRVGTASFADALVNAVLVEGGAKMLELRDAPTEFAKLVTAAAQRRMVANRVSLGAVGAS